MDQEGVGGAAQPKEDYSHPNVLANENPATMISAYQSGNISIIAHHVQVICLNVQQALRVPEPPVQSTVTRLIN